MEENYKICKNDNCNNSFLAKRSDHCFCSRNCQNKWNDEVKRLKRLAEKNKNNRVDNIDLIALAATKSGMSYGKFKALGGVVDGLGRVKFRKEFENRAKGKRSSESYNWNRKKIIQTNPDGTKTIFYSLKDVAESHGIGQSGMRHRIVHEKVVNGYSWDYMTDEKKEDKENETT